MGGITLQGRALVLTGTIGAGKTSVAEAISVALHQKGVRHGLLALDWLGQVYPPLDPDEPFELGLSLENLAAMMPSFAARGVDLFVMSATITSRAELGALRAALEGIDITVARVSASDGTILQRIERRDTGALREDFLERAVALGRAIAAEEMEDFVIENPDGGLQSAATAALAFMGWT